MDTYCQERLILGAMKVLLFAFLATITLAACKSGVSNRYNNKGSADQQEIGNPYSDGTGHAAGYKWAERTGGDCNGNSTSFNEGCEEYYKQVSNK